MTARNLMKGPQWCRRLVLPSPPLRRSPLAGDNDSQIHDSVGQASVHLTPYSIDARIGFARSAPAAARSPAPRIHLCTQLASHIGKQLRSHLICDSLPIARERLSGCLQPDVPLHGHQDCFCFCDPSIHVAPVLVLFRCRTRLKRSFDCQHITVYRRISLSVHVHFNHYLILPDVYSVSLTDMSPSC